MIALLILAIAIVVIATSLRIARAALDGRGTDALLIVAISVGIIILMVLHIITLSQMMPL